MKNFNNAVFSILSLVTIGLFTCNRVCDCVIILDSGNPARFIRGTFVDVNQPEFFGSSINEKQANNFPGHESVLTLTENVIEHLVKFNIAMTKPMQKVVENTDALSAVTTCQLARSRLTSTRIVNTLQAQLVNVATSSINEAPHNSFGISDSAMSETAAEFDQMKEDLRQYDVAALGKEPITHFQKALQNFDSIHLVVSSSNE